MYQLYLRRSLDRPPLGVRLRVRHIQRQVSGFDCSYPTVGAKSPQNIDSEAIPNDDIAIHCPEYQKI